MFKNYVVPLVLVSSLLIGCDRAGTSGTPPGMTATHVVSGPGYPTAKEALFAFYSSVDRGDLDTAKRVTMFVDEEFQTGYLEAMLAGPAAFREFDDAAIETFGDNVPKLGSPIGPLLKKVEDIPVEVRGSEATWKHQPDKTLALKKTDTGWKVDLRAMEAGMGRIKDFEFMRRDANRVFAVAKRIRDGEFESPQELRAALIANSKN